MSRAGQIDKDPSAPLPRHAGEGGAGGISPFDLHLRAGSAGSGSAAPFDKLRVTPARQLKLTWSPRECALSPLAVAGQGEASLRLARRLLQMDDGTLDQLQGVAGKQLIVVQGKSDLLPWVEGVQYLGVDPSTPSVLLPTNYQPCLPPELLAGALRAKADTQELIALLLQPMLVVPMGSARPVSRVTLASWLESA